MAKKASYSAVSAKIRHLIESGEKPNTPQGRREAAGMAFGMQRAHRLTKSGGYIRKKK